MKMNPEIKQKWLEALRSGQYKQGANYLRTESAHGVCHCCLGVLAEVIKDESVNGLGDVYIADSGTLSDQMVIKATDGECDDHREFSLIPASIALKHSPMGPGTADLSDSIIQQHDVEMVGIAALNDDHGYSFEVLANIIEEIY